MYISAIHDSLRKTDVSVSTHCVLDVQTDLRTHKGGLRHRSAGKVAVGVIATRHRFVMVREWLSTTNNPHLWTSQVLWLDVCGWQLRVLPPVSLSTSRNTLPKPKTLDPGEAVKLHSLAAWGGSFDRKLHDEPWMTILCKI